MKKIISTLLTISFLFLVISLDSNAASKSCIEKKIVNGSVFFIETTITEKTSFLPIAKVRSSKSKTATKTTNVKDSSGNVLWSLSITGTFSYNGSSSQCTSCSHNASSNSEWTIVNSSSSYSGNSATATATAQKKHILSYTMSESVTISCSASGKIE